MDLSALNYTDLVIVAALVLSTLFSLLKGLVKELLALVAWIVAIIVARIYSSQLSGHLVEMLDFQPQVALGATALLLIVGVRLVIGLLAVALQQVIKKTGLSLTDRLLGTVFGFVRGGILITLCLMVGKGLDPIRGSAQWKESQLIPYFMVYESWLSEQIGDIWAQRTTLDAFG